MPNPVPGYKVTTPFGVPGSWAAGEHTGEDYACPVGTPVVAASGGTVVKAGNQGDYGNRVDVRCDADGCEHSYSHLSKLHVTVGMTVGAGQMIGESGNTGRSTGPHLHYEERHTPYGYHDYREPQHSHSDTPTHEEDDDMPTPDEVARAVWATPMNATDGKTYPAQAFLEQSNMQAEDTVNYRLPYDGGVDLWTVLTATLDLCKEMKAALDELTGS